jgi:hypothetical protein
MAAQSRKKKPGFEAFALEGDAAIGAVAQEWLQQGERPAV